MRSVFHPEARFVVVTERDGDVQVGVEDPAGSPPPYPASVPGGTQAACETGVIESAPDIRTP